MSQQVPAESLSLLYKEWKTRRPLRVSSDGSAGASILKAENCLPFALSNTMTELPRMLFSQWHCDSPVSPLGSLEHFKIFQWICVIQTWPTLQNNTIYIFFLPLNTFDFHYILSAWILELGENLPQQESSVPLCIGSLERGKSLCWQSPFKALCKLHSWR